MPHKKRAQKNHIQVKKILAKSELSMLDKKRGKGSERVPRHDNNPADRRREEQILNDDDEGDDVRRVKLEAAKKQKKMKQHIQEELQSTPNPIPKKSRRNKYFLQNHPELKDVVIRQAPKVKKRPRVEDVEGDKVVEPAPKKLAEESKPSICDKLLSHMVTSRFRYLNEKLYTLTSKEAQKLFDQDPQSFQAYHQGYSVRRSMCSRWLRAISSF